MKVISSSVELKKHLSSLGSKDKQVGFVPTMGALHQGHLSLIKTAKENNQIVVVSIFVNPTQFDNASDLDKYPRTLEADVERLQTVACDVVFAPTIQDLYPNGTVSKTYDFEGLEHEMEGRFRKGHFDGVGTIVQKLFEVVLPNNAYFGEKDFQQLQIVRKMVQKEQLPVHVVGCPIYREESGLAMSSRNTRLTQLQFDEASLIYRTLNEVKQKISNESITSVNTYVKEVFNNNEVLELEYFEIADEDTLKTVTSKEISKSYRAFIAVFAGEVRLIDNMALY